MTAVGLAACAVAGCSSSTKTTSSSTTSFSTTTPTSSASSTPSSTTSTTNYASLLIKASDIPVPGLSLIKSDALTTGSGVAGLFADAADTRELGDTIVVLPSADGVQTAVTAAASAATSAIAGSTSADLGVGQGGKIFAGTTSGGSKQTTVAVFGEGRAFVTLQFDSKPGDVVPADVIKAVATAQDAAIKAGLK